uniref:Uncharacterized protein n=1 Tax=Panagrolaimus davidi TaxID=227884 RepID=A0A914PYP7_9BILA
MASKRQRLTVSPSETTTTSLKLSSSSSPHHSSSHEDACFSALILQAAAIQTLKEMMGETDWRATTPSSINTGQKILSRFAEANNFNSKSSAASGSSCYQTSGIAKKRGSHAGALINGMNANDLSSPSTSSSSSNASTRNAMLINGGRNGEIDFSTSNSSSSTSGLNYFKRGAQYKRATLPSIMTTSKFYIFYFYACLITAYR